MLPPFACPDGYSPREKSSALPVSGRFKSADEMIDAFCTLSSADGAMSSPDLDVDFAHDDVVAVPYDSEIGLYRRGGELWIRRTKQTCGSASYRTALFVVPKSQELHEQYCSITCK